MSNQTIDNAEDHLDDDLNNTHINLVNDDDTINDFQDIPTIPRSTSVVPQNSQNSHAESLVRNNNQIRVNVPPPMVASNSQGTSKTDKVSSAAKPTRICRVCNSDATQYGYCCLGCKLICHPFCASEEERETVDSCRETYVCDSCSNIFDSIHEEIRKHSDPTNKKNCPVTNKKPEAEISPSDEEGYDEPQRKQQNSSRLLLKKSITNMNTSSTFSNSMSENFFFKMQIKDLPTVVDSDLSWSVFYDSFIESKDYFTDYQNIVRLQKAIKDETVKRIGGKGLFNMRTYVKCIEDVNKRLRHNFNFLSTEAIALEKHIKIRAENKEKLVEFMDRVRNFCTMADAYKDTSYLTNKRFLACVTDVLPNYIKNKWETKQADLEDSDLIPSIKHLVRIFEKELPRLEASIRNDKLRNVDKKSDVKNSKFSSKNQKFNNFKANNGNNSPHSNNNNFALRSNNEHKNNFGCWFHRSNEHKSNKCKSLWNLDGKIVFELAKQNHVCTYCGQKQHRPCPNNANIKCFVEGCGLQHHAIFCFKRKGNNKKTFTNNKTNINIKPKEKRESKMDKPSTSQEDRQEVDSEDEVAEMLKNASRRNHFMYLPKNFEEYVEKFVNPNKTEYVNIHFDLNDSNSQKSIEKEITLLGVIVIRLEGKVNAAFLLDSGSTVSLIEKNLADALELYGPWFPLTLAWAGETTRFDKYSRIVKVNASNVFNQNNRKNIFFRTVENLKVSPQKFVANEFYQNYQNFDRLQLANYNKIYGVIGIDNLFMFDRIETIKAKSFHLQDFHGVRSFLGDYVYGTNEPLCHTYTKLLEKTSYCNTHTISSPNTLTSDEQNELTVMENEVMGLNYRQPSQNDREIYDDKLALELLNREVKKLDNDCHYVAPLLWKNIDIKLPTQESYKLALRRYLIIEKNALKLNKFDECIDQINNLLEKDYARELTREEIENPHEKSYYNPIFFIHPPNKRTRLIWDLAAKVDNKSLNDYLMPGPNLYNNMVEILFKMRENKYLFKGDIGEMFHQIKLKDEDTNALRFLFRPHEDGRIHHYKMNVLPFGAICSPVISQFTKDKIAKYHEIEFPQSSKIIQNNCYVDDIVKSVNSIKDCIKFTLEIKRILYSGGFNFLKINCNNLTALEAIKYGMTQEELNNNKLFSTEKVEKILGYNIDFVNDEISLSLCLDKLPKKLFQANMNPTKKQVLQTLMSIFDPIGFFQFFTSKLKLVYHKTCQNKAEWNEQLDEENLCLWLKCIEWMKELQNVKIPRKYCDDIKNAEKVQLWAFGDAGKNIMCGVIYIRFLNRNNEQINVRLTFAKTFVVPYRQKRTIPELEVNASMKICEMAQEVVKRHDCKFDEIIYVTDSMAVKEWICNGAKKPTVYVRNRLIKINQLTSPSQWLWVPSELMPADYGTKENAMPDINYQNEWFIPTLFRSPEENWTFLESNKVINLINTSNNDVNFDVKDNILEASKYSNINKLISLASFALKWKRIVDINCLENKISKIKIVLENDKHNRILKNDLKQFNVAHNQLGRELNDSSFLRSKSEKLAIKYAQYQSYESEIRILKHKKNLLRNNSLYKLNPFIDDNGILRAKSRIGLNDKNLSTFGYDRINPIILPSDHALTKLFILQTHNNNHHMLTNAVIINLMQRFYIPNIKRTVSKIIKNECYICIRQNAKPAIPQMGDLPGYRLAFHVPPFSYAIIDLAGPILTKTYRNSLSKRYIFVYSCLTTRAVHLELIEDLSSNSTLIALQNTINIRGAPKRIVTDNGTNFRGAQKIIQEAHSKWNEHLQKIGLITQPIEWDFAPAKSPHMQGAVERLVGLAKTALNKMTTTLNKNPHKYNDFQLRAILYEIVGMLNNRPLTMLPMENTETEFLTPNYFLMGRPNVQIVPLNSENPTDLKDYWVNIKMLTNLLWKHWLSAYIPLVMMREKWFDKTSPLEIDDIVIVADPNIANSWRLGRIVDINPGSQNQVRSITLMLGKSKSVNIKLDKINKNELIKVYKDEPQSVITRPSLAVAKLKV